MGKGGGADCRSALALDEQAGRTAVPGKSQRAQHTFTLLQQAGGFTSDQLLRDLNARDGRTVTPAKADAALMVHNAMMRWAPSSYQGHAGYVPEHEAHRWEMHFCLLLDGDRRANHLYFYNDSAIGGQWTVPSGAALRGWYRFDHDDGLLTPGTLRERVVGGLTHDEGLFVDALRSHPSATLNMSCDLREPGAAVEELAGRIGDPEIVSRLQTLLDDVSTCERRRVTLLMRDAADLAEDAGLSAADQAKLLRVSLSAPAFGVAPDLDLLDDERDRRLLAELTPRPANDGSSLPVLTPSSELGRLLADAQQGWLASNWCDSVNEAVRQSAQAADDPSWIDRARLLALRTPWHTSHGRKRFEAPARRQEARLRPLIALADRTLKTPPAPKRPPRLSA